MRRGTDSLHTFTLPFLLPASAEVVLTYTQDNYKILEKSGDDLEMYTDTDDLENTFTVVNVEISEEESFLFRKGYCNVQMRFKSDFGVGATNICHFEVKDSLSEEVLSG